MCELPLDSDPTTHFKNVNQTETVREVENDRAIFLMNMVVKIINKILIKYKNI